MNGKRGFGGGGGRGKAGAQGGQQGKDGQRRPMFRRRKVCKFCSDKIDDINYKDTKLLMPFVPERAKILPRRISGTCAMHQRKLRTAIMVRPGLMLYGIVPPPLASTIPLKPVMSLTSRVVAVKGVRPGEGIGYGLRFEADKPVTTAVIPAGYADGIDLRVSGRSQVLIRGRRVPIVGAVSMDMMMVDVTGLDEVSPGDEVVIIGRQGDESWQQIDAREMAAAIGTIPYEVVCRIGSRIERVYA